MPKQANAAEIDFPFGIHYLRIRTEVMHPLPPLCSSRGGGRSRMLETYLA